MQNMYQGYYGSLEAFLRLVRKTKVVSYHLGEVVVPKNVWVSTG